MLMFASSSEQLVQNTQWSLEHLVDNTFNWRTLAVFVIALCGAYILSRLITAVLIRVARTLSRHGDKAKTSEKALQFRRLETYLSIAIALIRATIFAAAIFVAWSATHSSGNNSAALIGAGTIFAVLGGATLAPMLRDFTAGGLMIAERWYNVGDFITLDPFMEDRGVVEQMNLRSTRIRKINGEVLWVHNQYIQKVSVQPNAVRTLAIDLFVRDQAKGMEIVEQLKSVLTVGPTMLVKPLEVAYSQQLGNHLWQITIIGQTAPGREWLLEKFAVTMLKEHDHMKNGENTKVIAYEPIVRYADPEAEKRFQRAVRIRSKEVKTSGRLAVLAAGAQHRYKQLRTQSKKPRSSKQSTSKTKA
jgi:hypothetical protein